MESVALVAPVTALEFAGDVLLAGERRAGEGAGAGRPRDTAGAAADALSGTGRHGP